MGVLEELRREAKDWAQGWRPVVGQDGEPLPYPYEVSPDGRVRHQETHEELEPYDGGPDGEYERVDLRAEGEPRKQVYVHQLVAWAHVPRDAVGMVVDHRDGDTRNNSADNLRLVRPSENPKIPRG